MQKSGNNSLHGMAGCADGMKSHITTAFQSWPASQSHQMWQFWRPQLCPACLRFTDFNEQLETIMAMGVLNGAERPSPSDDRCLGLGPLLSKCKWKTNGLSSGAPTLLAHMYRCTYTPTLQGGHAKNTGNHSIPDRRVQAYSAESAEVKVFFTLRSLSQ